MLDLNSFQREQIAGQCGLIIQGICFWLKTKKSPPGIVEEEWSPQQANITLLIQQKVWGLFLN